MFSENNPMIISLHCGQGMILPKGNKPFSHGQLVRKYLLHVEQKVCPEEYF
jgi:hypothetical protein